MPEWPPITGTLVVATSMFFASATNVFALTMSSVLTPNILPYTRTHIVKTGDKAAQPCSTHRLGSKTPACLYTSEAMGTVELTGLEMMPSSAVGHVLHYRELKKIQ